MDPDLESWAEQFRTEHGYFPWEDPTLTGEFGMSPEDAVAEHLAARDWGRQFHEATGNVPTYHDYRHGQPMRWTRDNRGEFHLLSGFNGMPPEERGGPSWGKWPSWSGSSPYGSMYDYWRKTSRMGRADTNAFMGRRVPAPYSPY